MPSDTSFSHTLGTRRHLVDCSTKTMWKATSLAVLCCHWTGHAFAPPAMTASSSSSSLALRPTTSTVSLLRVLSSHNRAEWGDCDGHDPAARLNPHKLWDYRSTPLSEVFARRGGPQTTYLNMKKNDMDDKAIAPSPEYIDDCFGLIFLTGFLVVHDAIFTACFVACSTLALWATRQGLFNKDEKGNLFQTMSAERQRRLVPAIVAATTLFISTTMTAFGAFDSFSLAGDLDPNAPWIEVAVCLVSILYGAVSKIDDVDESN